MNNIYEALTVFVSLISMLLSCFTAEATPIIFGNNSSNVQIGKQVELLIDSSGFFNTKNIIAEGKFRYSEKVAPIYFLKKETLWGRFSVTNQATDLSVYFCIEYPNISHITLYRLDDEGRLVTVVASGNSRNFYPRFGDHVDFNFNLNLVSGQTGTYYFTINSRHPIELRMALMSFSDVVNVHSFQTMIMSAYLGCYSFHFAVQSVFILCYT